MKNLKFFILPALAVISMMFASCNDDNNDIVITDLTASFSDTLSVVIAGQTYKTADKVTYTVTSHPNSTMDITIPDYTLEGTPMGDLLIGGYKVTGLTITQKDDNTATLYKDYSNDGLTFNFSRMVGGTWVTKTYNLNIAGAENITYKATNTSLTIVNNFQPEGMPMPITSTFYTTISKQ